MGSSCQRLFIRHCCSLLNTAPAISCCRSRRPNIRSVFPHISSWPPDHPLRNTMPGSNYPDFLHKISVTTSHFSSDHFHHKQLMSKHLHGKIRVPVLRLNPVVTAGMDFDTRSAETRGLGSSCFLPRVFPTDALRKIY